MTEGFQGNMETPHNNAQKSSPSLIWNMGLSLIWNIIDIPLIYG